MFVSGVSIAGVGVGCTQFGSMLGGSVGGFGCPQPAIKAMAIIGIAQIIVRERIWAFSVKPFFSAVLSGAMALITFWCSN